MNEDKSNFKPIFVSQEEEDVINDIRALEFGRVSINIQNNVMVNKEITKTVKNIRRKNIIPNNHINNNDLDNYN
ncbi:MAG: hypothetical protein KAI57_03125 [Candidatus Pacebacteria bacterium]|nr:hypothetical protein [Candidatus Paceibacterota bacterium]